MNAGLLKVTDTVLTVTVIPSITLCIKEYFAGPVYEESPCGEDKSLKSSHVSTSIWTSSKLYKYQDLIKILL